MTGPLLGPPGSLNQFQFQYWVVPAAMVNPRSICQRIGMIGLRALLSNGADFKLIEQIDV
jgi:hypothetical protein